METIGVYVWGEMGTTGGFCHGDSLGQLRFPLRRQPNLREAQKLFRQKVIGPINGVSSSNNTHGNCRKSREN